MSKAEEIAARLFPLDGWWSNTYAVKTCIAAVNEALEWAATECEKEAEYRDLPHRAHFCADRIRKGKSA